MSAEDAIATFNVTVDDFWWYDQTCKVFSWLAQGDPNEKAFSIVQRAHDFLKNSESQNETEAWAELGEYLGTTADRALYVYNYYFGPDWPFYPATSGGILQVMPHTGEPHNNWSQVVGVTASLGFLIVLFVGLRLYSRILINGFIRGYDWVLIAAVVTTLSYGILNSYAISTCSRNQLMCDRVWRDYVIELHTHITNQVLYPLSVVLIKTSLLLFYWGLTTWWPLRVATIATFIIVLANNISYTFGIVYRCLPPVSYEGYDFFETTCSEYQYKTVETVCGSINIATDIVIWMIPLPMVWKIMSGTRERILSCLTFGVGALACIACAIRFNSVKAFLDVTTLLPPDQSVFLTWTFTELSLAVICSCAPALRALMLHKAPSLLGSTHLDTDETSKSDEKSVRLEKGTNPVVAVNSATPTDSYAHSAA